MHTCGAFYRFSCNSLAPVGPIGTTEGEATGFFALAPDPGFTLHLDHGALWSPLNQLTAKFAPIFRRNILGQSNMPSTCAGGFYLPNRPRLKYLCIAVFDLHIWSQSVISMSSCAIPLGNGTHNGVMSVFSINGCQLRTRPSELAGICTPASVGTPLAYRRISCGLNR